MPRADLVKVICVDDQESMLRLHRYAFSQLGIRKVTECTSAQAAMEAVLSTDFDVMTLDWNMPGTDGLTLFKIARHPNATALYVWHRGIGQTAPPRFPDHCPCRSSARCF